MRRWVTIPGGPLVCLHFNSWFARAVNPGGVNNCVTLSARHVYVSRDWITNDGLAHEAGHVQQARRLGWRYLPWVLWGYVTHGYENSPAERDADAYMAAHRHEYPAVLQP